MKTATIVLLACALFGLVAACSEPEFPMNTARVGQIPVNTLVVDECIEEPATENPDRARAALCAEAEALYKVSDVVEAEPGQYPGPEALRDVADESCASTKVLVMFPTEGRWVTGDRTIVCFIANH